MLGGLAQRLQDGVRATIVALGQSHAQRLAALVESSDDAILSIDLDANIATWNRAAEELFGYEGKEIIGKSVTVLIPADRQREEPAILRRIARGEHVQHYETVRLHKDGRPIPVSLSVSPILDSTGTVIGASKIARDISERKRAEAALAKRAEEQAALYRFTDRLFRTDCVEETYDAALDAIVQALRCERASILLFDDAGSMKFVAWRGLSDGYRKAVEGHSPWSADAVNPEPITIADVGSAELEAGLKQTVRSEGIGALAFIPLTVRGKLAGKFMTYYDRPHTFEKSEIELAVTIARQLGFGLERVRAEEERRRSEEARELLLGESRHRIKNTLATVQAIAIQTLRMDHAEGLESFLARLRALGEAHDVLTTENWDRAELHEVVMRAIKPFPTDRFSVEGPQAWLSSQASLTLTLCLHELATNAAKYGALSNQRGRVRLSWQAPVDDAITCIWEEIGGPAVRPPERTGFGSQLIKSVGLGSGLDYRPEGVRCTLEILL